MVASLLALSLLAAPPPAARSRPYDVGHYRIDFKLLEGDAFENKVSLTFQSKAPLPRLELDAYGLEIRAVTAEDGSALPFTTREDAAARTGVLTVTPAMPFKPGVAHTVHVTCAGKANAREHAGLFVVRDGKESWYYTQFEPNWARRFFPSNDDPSDKATTELVATVPEPLVALSNGEKRSDERVEEGGRSFRRVHWQQQKPHATYLVALAVGRFEPVDVGSTVPAKLWLRPGTADRGFVAVNATREHLEQQVRVLGVKYPWEKYDQVAVPGFIWGGMENTSLVTLRENRAVVPARAWLIHRGEISSLISHELAHQWFGNLVTLRTWDDTWLNEGFATWLGGRSESLVSGTDRVAVERAADTFVDYLHVEDGPRSHPLQARNAAPEEIFDVISYTKGARVLEMLETWLGAEAFRAGLKAYLEHYAYQNASSEDFFNAMGKATKREKEVALFKAAWLPRRGYPVLQPAWSWSGGELTVTVKQRPNHASEKGPFVFKLPVTVHRRSEPSYHEELLVTVDKPSVTLKVKLPAEPQWITWNRGGNALARIDAASLPEAEWILAAREDSDPAWRLLALFALAEPLTAPGAAEGGRTPSSSALTTLLAALSGDPSPYVRAGLLGRLADSEWKRLPVDFGPVLLGLARKPEGLGEDGEGNYRVRAAAASLLGRVEFREARRFLLSQLALEDLDVNLVEAVAVGAAGLGDDEALSALSATLKRQKGRGTYFYKSALSGLAAFPAPQVIPHLQREFDDAALGAEAVRTVAAGLSDNLPLLRSAEGVAFVRRYVMDEARGDDTRHWMLDLLDDVKTPEAKAALEEIRDKGQVRSLREQARKVLESNFAATARGGTP
jgi:aminopeptidase N